MKVILPEFAIKVRREAVRKKSLQIGDVVTISEKSEYFEDWKDAPQIIVAAEWHKDKIVYTTEDLYGKSGLTDGWSYEELSVIDKLPTFDSEEEAMKFYALNMN